MNRIENVFRVLQLEPTTDKRTIKRAYANLVKQYHPEEHPDEWKEIHDAYKIAESYAEDSQTTKWKTLEEVSKEAEQEIEVKKKRSVFSYTPIEQEEEENLLSYIENQLDEREERREAHIAYMREKALCEIKTMKSVYELYKWEAYFKKYAIEYLCCKEIMAEWEKIVTDMSYDEKLINYFQARLDEIKNFSQKYGIIYIKENGTDTLKRIQSAINKKEGKNLLFWLFVIVASISVLFLFDPIESFLEDTFQKIQTKQEAQNPMVDVSKLTEDLYWQRDFQKKIEGKTDEEIKKKVERGIPLSDEVCFMEYPTPTYEEGISLMPVTDKSVIGLSDENILYAGQLTSSQYEFAGFLCINRKKLELDDWGKICIYQNGQLIEASEYKEQNEVNSDTLLYFEIGDYIFFWLKIPPSEKQNGPIFFFTR